MADKYLQVIGRWGSFWILLTKDHLLFLFSVSVLFLPLSVFLSLIILVTLCNSMKAVSVTEPNCPGASVWLLPLTYTHTSAQDEDTRQLFLCFLSWVSLTHTQVQWRVTQWGGHQPVTCTCVATGHDDTLWYSPPTPRVCVWEREKCGWCCYHRGRGQKSL